MVIPALERKIIGPDVTCYGSSQQSGVGEERQGFLTSNKCFPTAGRSLTTGTPANFNSSAEPIPLTKRRCGDEIAPADKITSLLAATRYFGDLSEAATCTPTARGTLPLVEKRIFSTHVFVAIVKLGLPRTSEVRYAVAEELPKRSK